MLSNHKISILLPLVTLSLLLVGATAWVFTHPGEEAQPEYSGLPKALDR